MEEEVCPYAVTVSIFGLLPATKRPIVVEVFIKLI
jgi:hypothetical protein